MKMKVNNKTISVGKVKVGGLERSCLFMIGDTKEITSCSIFDTPSSSVIYKPDEWQNIKH
ncbi:MAG TPA: hypothetical protein VJ824_05405 [Bacillota bacterium]|nr:hypothetical protein [Bacillota bacterium]